MIVTLKTLQEHTFTVEIDPSVSVKCLKETIERFKGPEYPAEFMKLMYAGKFLMDNHLVREYNLEERKFVIMVVKLPRTVPQFPGHDDSTESLFRRDSRSAEHENIVRVQYEEMVHHIIELGFERSDVEFALAASFNNPDRAVEYLINSLSARSPITNPLARENASIPVVEEELKSLYYGGRIRSLNKERSWIYMYFDADAAGNDSVSARTHPDQSGIGNNLQRDNITHAGSEARNPSAENNFMPSQERIIQIFSDAVAECQNRTRLQNQLAEIQEYAQVDEAASIQSNLDNSLNALAASIANPLGSPATGSSDSVPNMASDAGARRSTFLPSGDSYTDVIQNAFMSQNGIDRAGHVQDIDHEAIDRLMQLGFSGEKAVEAYFLFNKNENAAADFLFSQLLDD